jgi:hypothetical protein
VSSCCQFVGNDTSSTTMSKTTLRIFLATTIVFHSALSFVPSSRHQKFSKRHEIFQPRHLKGATSPLASTSLQSPLLCVQRRRKSGLCVSQQQNEYTESPSAATRNTSSDLNSVISAEFKLRNRHPKDGRLGCGSHRFRNGSGVFCGIRNVGGIFRWISVRTVPVD